MIARLVGRAILAGMLLAMLGSVGAWIAGWPQFAIAILAGAVLGAINFAVLALLVTRIVVPGAERPKTVYLLAFAVKFLFLALCLFLYVAVFRLNIPGILAGLTTILISVVAAGLMDALSGRTGKA